MPSFLSGSTSYVKRTQENETTCRSDALTHNLMCRSFENASIALGAFHVARRRLDALSTSWWTISLSVPCNILTYEPRLSIFFCVTRTKKDWNVTARQRQSRSRIQNSLKKATAVNRQRTRILVSKRVNRSKFIAPWTLCLLLRQLYLYLYCISEEQFSWNWREPPLKVEAFCVTLTGIWPWRTFLI